MSSSIRRLILVAFLNVIFNVRAYMLIFIPFFFVLQIRRSLVQNPPARFDHIRSSHRRAEFSRGWQCIFDDDTLNTGQEPLKLIEIRVGTSQEPGRRQWNHARASGGKRDQQRDDTTVSPYPAEFGWVKKLTEALISRGGFFSIKIIIGVSRNRSKTFFYDFIRAWIRKRRIVTNKLIYKY